MSCFAAKLVKVNVKSLATFKYINIFPSNPSYVSQLDDAQSFDVFIAVIIAAIVVAGGVCRAQEAALW